jgi:hypothetical protein
MGHQPNSIAGTSSYLDLLRTNVDALAAALAGDGSDGGDGNDAR